MLSVLLENFDEPLLAQVKKGNVASMKVAERLGFVLEKKTTACFFIATRSLIWLLNPIIKLSH